MPELPRIIPFDSACLAAVVAETRHLIGGRIQKVVRVRPHTVALAIYAGDEEEYVSFSVDPRLPGAYLMSRRPDTDEVDHFVRTLRRFAIGGKIGKWEQRGLDRVLDIGFSTNEGIFQLAFEFVGSQSNALLVDGNLQILGAERKAKAVGGRDLKVGNRYEGLPPRDLPPITEASHGDDLSGFEGFSPMIRLLVEAGYPGDEIVRRWKESDWSPCYLPERGAYPLPLEALGVDCHPRQTYSVGAELSYEGLVRKLLADQARRETERQLTGLRDKLQKVLVQIEKAEEEAQQSEHLQQVGDLILAYQTQIPERAETYETMSFAGEPVTIKLDPELGAVKNAQKYYKRSKKLKASAAAVPARKAEVQDQLRQVLADIDRLERTPMQAFYDQALKSAREDVQNRHGEREKPFEGKAIRTSTTASGRAVVYGLNAEANDYLMRRLGKPNDLWFHVRGATSAHAILMTEGKPDRVSPADIAEVAKLVVRHSSQKHSSIVPVDYTLKKFVRRQKGKVLGAATYTNEKTVHVERED